MPDARDLIMALPNPVIVVGHDNRISGINGPAQHLLGNNFEGWQYVMALRQPAVLDAVEATLIDGGQRITQYSSNDGARDTTWEVTVSGVTLSNGRAVVLSFHDTTAVEDAGEMRRDFVANVSHEMRTPLTALIGFIETLRGPARTDAKAQDRFLGIMEQEAGRMHRLVEDLLSLSRVEAQERIKPTEIVCLSTLIENVAETLAPVAKAREITLVRDLPSTPVEIVGDREQLWQVISNLIENAIKYGGDGNTVTLRLTSPEHDATLMQVGVRLSVLDQGAGIPAHNIARLTERFYRVDTHRSREIGGTGLGLAIVKHIITRHRGRLRIHSELGQGSEFTAILPIDATIPAE